MSDPAHGNNTESDQFFLQIAIENREEKPFAWVQTALLISAHYRFEK